jgi:transcriptional regulator with PAS, ATPase and Fis domain
MSTTLDDVSATIDGGSDPAPVIVLVSTGTTPRVEVIAATGPVELGRSDHLDDDRMSREHAVVRFERGAWVVADRGSRNGTFVDGERITGELQHRGDAVLRLGHSVFLLVPDGRGYDRLPPDDGTYVIGPELARVYAEARRHANEPMLLVQGDSGAGKDLIARQFHDAGPRSAGPFVAVNCAAIPEGVAERLLFGARKGAFSGATDAAGYLQSASGGTLFLDEIAELELAVQAKLLRAIETHEVLPIGATAPIAVELGIVAASHRELRGEVAGRRFRDDLYYRIARATVRLPPLRERKLDIARLVVRELAAVDRSLVAHARLLEGCCTRPWPGNVRELRSAVRVAAGAARAAARTTVRVEDLPLHAGMPVRDEPPPIPDLPALHGAPDRDAILGALERAGGVVSVAARTLGLHRTQLYRLMDKHAIVRDEG